MNDIMILWRDLTKVISTVNERPRDCHVSAGNQTTLRGEHSSKELFKHRINSYAEHLQYI
jgi:hypothetical protein